MEDYEYVEPNETIPNDYSFHKIEKMYYTNGQQCAERHLVDGQVVDEKCWNPKGVSMPIEYLDSIKTLSVDWILSIISKRELQQSDINQLAT